MNSSGVNTTTPRQFKTNVIFHYTTTPPVIKNNTLLADTYLKQQFIEEGFTDPKYIQQLIDTVSLLRKLYLDEKLKQPSTVTNSTALGAG